MSDVIDAKALNDTLGTSEFEGLNKNLEKLKNALDGQRYVIESTIQEGFISATLQPGITYELVDNTEVGSAIMIIFDNFQGSTIDINPSPNS